MCPLFREQFRHTNHKWHKVIRAHQQQWASLDFWSLGIPGFWDPHGQLRVSGDLFQQLTVRTKHPVVICCLVITMTHDTTRHNTTRYTAQTQKSTWTAMNIAELPTAELHSILFTDIKRELLKISTLTNIKPKYKAVEEADLWPFTFSTPQSSLLRERPDDDVHVHLERHREDGLPQEDRQETRGPHTQAMQVREHRIEKKLKIKSGKTCIFHQVLHMLAHWVDNKLAFGLYFRLDLWYLLKTFNWNLVLHLN